MADDDGDRPLAPRRSLKGPVLPPPPPELAEEARLREEAERAAQEARERKDAEREARKQAQVKAREDKANQKAEAEAKRAQEKQAREDAKRRAAEDKAANEKKQAEAKAAEQRQAQQRDKAAADADATRIAAAIAAATGESSAAAATRSTPPAAAAAPVPSPNVAPPAAPARGRSGRGAPRKQRRAQLRLAQIDAWSVMKTSFLLSIALGIVLVVAVAIIMSVLGAAGVWDSVNSIVQQAVGSDGGEKFDIQKYVGPSRVLGFTMIVAVVDVILITAIATLSAFLYNLAAALLGGIEVTLAED